ncbi:hypothetical protein FJT64_015189 [Amphibalanus amphitrite]|uniref:Uncharacterized protein n=1 Tax=Amphibalanus amphitrite TaxID=1232801 RepID=A0A6A4XA25_AMPAM|nr:hypothetical protein FJT64_015189 [Amphibalanus amphitrite]
MQRMAICYTAQFNSAQANEYFVLTQRDGEPVMLQGNAFGDLVTDTATPLFLKPGGDENCAMDSLETLASSGTFDLSEMMYSLTFPSTYSITNGGTDLNGMNISLNNLNNGCCTIQRIF